MCGWRKPQDESGRVRFYSPSNPRFGASVPSAGLFHLSTANWCSALITYKSSRLLHASTIYQLHALAPPIAVKLTRASWCKYYLTNVDLDVMADPPSPQAAKITPSRCLSRCSHSQTAEDHHGLIFPVAGRLRDNSSSLVRQLRWEHHRPPCSISDDWLLAAGCCPFLASLPSRREAPAAA